MARLNEVAAPTESIESLKRKFMRQNRDIARANSTQSLRIRSLENEISRLLAENLGLQEQILRLQNELENGKAQRIVDHNNDVKSQLQSKLLEVCGMIADLGQEPPPKQKTPKNAKTTKGSPKTSPDQRNWKNMCTLSEAVANQEGRLPPILEDKTYPRRTLERLEIADLVPDADVGADTTGSPEIGPPPVSQFVDEDPVQIELPKRARKSDPEDLAELDPVLSINLEQRRKRKDSLAPSDVKRRSNTQSNQEASGPLKTGAKRKLSVRDDDQPDNSSRSVDEPVDDFRFTRKSSEVKTSSKPMTQIANSLSKPIRELAVAKGASREKRVGTTTTTTRKALAPKNVNDSPKKNKQSLIQDEIKAAKAGIPKLNPLKDKTEENDTEPVIIQPMSQCPAETIEVLPEPETPAGVDIFSPTSQPSTARVESRDTPPPPDLNAEGQRPSRRARSAVSYAEPSLRDKMRRPTKELVDAVAGEGKSNRGSIVKLEEGVMSTGTGIKAEPEDEDAWKRMPLASSATVENSPLRNKAQDQDSLPSSITTHRKRRESLLAQASEDVPKTGTETAISNLLSEHRKAKAAAKARTFEKEAAGEGGEEGLPKAMAKLDIYDFNETSPQNSSLVSNSSTGSKPILKSRRHSSIPQEFASDTETSDIDSTKKERTLTKRRQSSLGLKTASAKTEAVGEKTVKKSSSNVGLSDTRGDRIGARRRSMML